MSRYSIVSLVLAAGLSFPCLASAQSMNTLPPNTIECTDWTHNADDSWRAHNDAIPFDFGAKKDVSFNGQTIVHGKVSIENYDLVDALNRACARRF